MGGKVYGGTGNIGHLFVFDPATGRSTDLGKAIGPGDYGVRALTVGRDGKIYGGTGYYEGDAQFFVYDPAARRLLSKRAAIGGQNYINALTTGADGKIYGGTGNEGRLFVYNPADGSLVDKGSDMEGWGVTCLAPGPGGLIYGGAGGGWLFSYNPASGAVDNIGLAPAGAIDNIGQAPAGAFDVPCLSAGLDGQLYGGTSGTDGHLFSYNPVTRAFSDLGLAQWEDSRLCSLLTGSDGVIYGATGTSHGAIVTYNPANHPYRPGGSATSIDVVPAIVDRGESTASWGYLQALTVGKDGRVFLGGNGGRLSVYQPGTGQTQDLGIALAGQWQIRSLTTGMDGRIYGGTGYDCALFVFNAANGSFTNLGQPVTGESYLSCLTTGLDGRIYGGTIGFRSGFVHGHLFVHDPASGISTDLGPVLGGDSEVWSLTTGRDGKIYGGTGWRGEMFVYDPATGRITDLGRALPSETYVDSLTVAPDGTLWGGTYPNAHLFHYDPTTRAFSDRGQTIPGESDVLALQTSADGQIFGAASGHAGVLFRYDPSRGALTRLGKAIPGAAYVNGLCFHPNGLLYGVTGASFAHLFSYDRNFVFRWGSLTYEANTPANTGMTVDVLDLQGHSLMTGVASGTRVSANPASYPALRLRANLSTNNMAFTPRLARWSVRWSPPLVVGFDPGGRIVQPGDVFAVQVAADNVLDLGSYAFTVHFDPALLQVQDAVRGDFLASTGRGVAATGPNINYSAGTVTLSATSSGSAPGPNGSGVLLTLTLRAKALGACDLTLSDLSVKDTHDQPDLAAAVGSSRVLICQQVWSVDLPIVLK